MYIGIDHGTTSLRFAADNGKRFKMSREAAKEFTIEDLQKLGPVEDIAGIALCYSMGDNFTQITPVDKLKNRGVITRGRILGGEHASLMRYGNRAFRQLPFRVFTEDLTPIRVSRFTRTRPARKNSVSRTLSPRHSVIPSSYPTSAQTLSRY